jgi:pilus assembly protein CpaB
MNRRMFVAAAAAGLTGALSLHLYLASLEQALAGGAPQRVVVLTRDVALGETLTRGALSLRDLPERYVEDRHVLGADLERALGARVTGALHGGATLLWSDLDVMQEGRTLAGLVRPGMRAYALSEVDTSFDGLLRPGDRVDVLWTAAEGLEATVIMQNLLVLTVGNDLGDEHARELKRTRSERVTLSVTGEQAAALSSHQRRGRLRLLLRNPQDLIVLESTRAPSAEEARRVQ